MTSLLPDPPLHAMPPAAGSLPVPPLMPPLMPPSTPPSTSPPRIVTDAVADSTRDDTGDPVIGILSPHDSHRPYYIAGAVAAAIVLGTLLLLPFGARPGPVIPAMVTVYAVTMSLVEAMTAYLLALQFRSTGHVSLAALAGG